MTDAQQRALSRAKLMLHVAGTHAKRHGAEFTSYYDEADCTGECILDDCGFAIDELEHVFPEVDPAVEWEAVARNMAQVLVNTAAWIEEWEHGGFSTRVLPSIVQPAYLRSVFANQLAAHNLTVAD